MDVVSESMQSVDPGPPEEPSGSGAASGRGQKQPKAKHVSMGYLRAALHRRPEVLRLVVSLRRLVEKKNSLVAKLKAKVKKLKTKRTKTYHDSACQTDIVNYLEDKKTPAGLKAPVETSEDPPPEGVAVAEEGAGAGWSLGGGGGADGATQAKSLAEQVAEAAQSALAQTGMVYVESAGMYYDYKSGYYYNSELGLYYHNSTGCYYYYSEENNEFTYHSHADTRGHAALHAATHATTHAPNTQPLAPETEKLLLKKEKLRKRNKKANQEDEEEQGPTEPKRKKHLKKDKKKKKHKKSKGKEKKSKTKDRNDRETNENIDLTSENDEKSDKNNSEENEKIETNENNINEKLSDSLNGDIKCTKEKIEESPDKNEAGEVVKDIEKVTIEEDNDLEKLHSEEKKVDAQDVMEDGECSQTASEAESDSDDSISSNSTNTDVDESIAKHHPPCMRVVVRETTLPKLRVGSLFLVTKDGGTLGREGEDHAVLIRDENISRIHLQFIYNDKKRCYEAIDLGSKNGTILNGNRMSESQQVSQPLEVAHGSTLQVGESKLLCHVHAGADTCGHCEPGLLMAADDADKRSAYTRSCSVKRQHALELARLKNRYAPEPLAIEEGTYKDRARARREQVGSSHHAEKTQQADIDTSIATDNKGFQMLAKMGWKSGEGLGREQQGEKEPVPLVSNEGTSGLGAAGAGPRTVRLAARAPLRPAARAFRDPLEED